jgi:G3E family GTPase
MCRQRSSSHAAPLIKTGDVPAFKRVVIETTGLADPAPILHGLITDLMMLNYFRLGQVVTVVDAYHGWKTLDAQMEAVKQAAVADRIVLSKGDITERDTLERLSGRLRSLNPIAPLIEVVNGEVEPQRLFGSVGFDIAEKTAEVRSWLAAEAQHHEHGHVDVNRHDQRIRAHCFTFDHPLQWEAVSGWLDWLAGEYAEHLLRVKGLLNVSGQAQPVVIQGVHHLSHPPPATLPHWPDEDQRSRLVFIVRDLDRAALEAGAPA